tara:strand:- start:852 stop:1205 length:354 start_codon:yes stop_codon:yes gene_type:complete
MDYNFIKKFHMNPPDIKLERHPDIEKLYQQNKKVVKNYENFLKQKLFKKNETWILTKNEYPYYFIDNTKHFVMWFNGNINWNLINFLFRDEDVVYFENKDYKKSIKSINHVHIFLNS